MLFLHHKNFPSSLKSLQSLSNVEKFGIKIFIEYIINMQINLKKSDF